MDTVRLVAQSLLDLRLVLNRFSTREDGRLSLANFEALLLTQLGLNGELTLTLNLTLIGGSSDGFREERWLV